MFATRPSALPRPPPTVRRPWPPKPPADPRRSATSAGARSSTTGRSCSSSSAPCWRASEGEAAVTLHERAAALGKRSRAGDHAATRALEELVAGLSLDDAQVLMRSLSRWFQLINLAEDNERVRRLRRRERAGGGAPRAGSLRAAILHLAERGTTAAELREMLAGAELRLVMTAHPTEARRRTTVEKLARIFARLRDLDEHLPVPGDEAAAAPRARGHDPGAVGLRRGPRRLPHPARRGPRRPRLLRLDAAPRRARALPRARGGGRGGLPGRGDRGAAAAHVRLLDGRRPRRQPERHRRRHRGGARDDADRLPAPARGPDRAARPARLALRPARRPLARARGGAGAARRALPRARPRGSSDATPRSPTAASSRCWPRACARRASAARAATRSPAELLADLRTAQRCAAGGQGAVRRRHPAARHDPPGRGVRLPLRPPRRPRARRPPRRGDRRGAVRARRPRGLRVARPRGAHRAARARDRAAAAADPVRSERAVGRDAGGRRHVPHARRAAPRPPHRAPSSPTSSPAPRSPPTCSRCCC